MCAGNSISRNWRLSCFFSFFQKLYVNQQLKQNQYAVPLQQLYSSKSQSYSDKKGFLVLLSHFQVSNRVIMERYKTLVSTHYKEPGQDGQFEDCTKEVLEELCEDD